MNIQNVDMGYAGQVGSFTIPAGTRILIPVYDDETGDQVDTTTVILLQPMHVQSVSSIQPTKIFWERTMRRDNPFS